MLCPAHTFDERSFHCIFLFHRVIDVRISSILFVDLHLFLSLAVVGSVLRYLFSLFENKRTKLQARRLFFSCVHSSLTKKTKQNKKHPSMIHRFPQSIGRTSKRWSGAYLLMLPTQHLYQIRIRHCTQSFTAYSANTRSVVRSCLYGKCRKLGRMSFYWTHWYLWR